MITTAAACVFCQIVSGHAPATIVRRWTEAIAIVPLNPVTPGHLLVIPTQHVTDASTAPAVTAMTVQHAATLLAESGQQANLIANIGPEATQTVFHLHWHVVPRTAGDGLHLPWAAR